MSSAFSKLKKVKAAAMPAPKLAAVAVPWGPGAAIVMTLLAFIVGQVGGGILIGMVAALIHPHTASVDLNALLSSVGVQFVYVLLAEFMTLALLWGFLRRRRGTPASLGLRRRPIWSDLGYALIGFAAYMGMYIAMIMLLVGGLHANFNQQQELGFDNVYNAVQRLMTFASLVVIAPVAEELIFRGFLYTGLRSKLDFPWATVITSLAFAAPHLLESKGSGLLWAGAIDTLILSFVLCYLREKTGNLWAGIAVHAIKNGIAFVYLFGS